MSLTFPHRQPGKRCCRTEAGSRRPRRALAAEKNQRCLPAGLQIKNDDFGETSAVFLCGARAPPSAPGSFPGGAGCLRLPLPRHLGRGLPHHPARPAAGPAAPGGLGILQGRCPPSGAACGSRWTRRSCPRPGGPAADWSARGEKLAELPSGWRRCAGHGPAAPDPAADPVVPRRLPCGLLPCRCSARSTGASWFLLSQRRRPRHQYAAHAGVHPAAGHRQGRRAPPCSWWTWPLRDGCGASALYFTPLGEMARRHGITELRPTCSPSGSEVSGDAVMGRRPGGWKRRFGGTPRRWGASTPNSSRLPAHRRRSATDARPGTTWFHILDEPRRRKETYAAASHSGSRPSGGLPRHRRPQQLRHLPPGHREKPVVCNDHIQTLDSRHSDLLMHGRRGSRNLLGAGAQHRVYRGSLSDWYDFGGLHWKPSPEAVQCWCGPIDPFLVI